MQLSQAGRRETVSGHTRVSMKITTSDDRKGFARDFEKMKAINSRRDDKAGNPYLVMIAG